MLIRWSKAKRNYTCTRCLLKIYKDTDYGRDEPFPAARYAGSITKSVCSKCLIPYLKELGIKRFWFLFEGKNYIIDSPDHLHDDVSFLYRTMAHPVKISDDTEQLALDFANYFERSDQVLVSETQVQIIEFSTTLLADLQRNPLELYSLNPEQFEIFLCERLVAMGMGVTRSESAYKSDGGIDIVAWPERNAVFPFLIAVQAKHHKQQKLKAGPKVVREFGGVVQDFPFLAGMLVTNTTFTATAKWVASHRGQLIRLRDFEDLKRWIRNEFLDEEEWREIPAYIEYAPGKKLWIPRKKILSAPILGNER